MADVTGAGTVREILDKMLQSSDLSFRDFMEVALYHPSAGYYAGERNPVSRGGDYVTSPVLSEVFAFALGRLVDEFLRRAGDEVTTIVDVGCGDGSLIRALAARTSPSSSVRYVGVERSLGRASRDPRVLYVPALDAIPRDGVHLVLSNELFDAMPFARLVQRGEELHELFVTSGWEWSEKEAPGEYRNYFLSRGIRLEDGQFADVALEWETSYAELCTIVTRGLVVTFDYGYPESQLFASRARRYGTAAAYAGHRVSRDLLANPGGQDLTAHINFTDLMRSGERRGFSTLFFDRQAKFLLSLGITEHELFMPSTELESASVELFEQRDAARQLVLPDGIGHDIRVLVQTRGMEGEGWSFQRPLF
jgi:SAM-dependent MidA family methyltransferase